MTEVKIGYKVISTISRESLVIPKHFGRRMYLLNKTVKPQKGYGPLTVFENKLAANLWKLSGAEESVVQCKYTKSKANKVWLNIEKVHYNMELKELPQGTVLASSVTCLE